jgi:hypothetical protein
MQETPGEYFGNLLYQKAAPSACNFLKDFFVNGRKMRKAKGLCRGHGHMQGTPGEYFWNCLYFAQPLKRQFPLLLVIFCLRFLFKWQKNAKRRGTMEGVQPHVGDTWGIFLQLFEFGTAMQKATPHPSAGDFFVKDFVEKWRKNAKEKGTRQGPHSCAGEPR